MELPGAPITTRQAIAFVLAAWAVIGNDALQTLGPFLQANRGRISRIWQGLYLALALCVVLVLGWLTHGGDGSWGRLQAYPPPSDLAWSALLAPLSVLLLTRLGAPVSTSFLLLIAFRPANLPLLLRQSLLGYGVALVAGIVAYGLPLARSGRSPMPTGAAQSGPPQTASPCLSAFGRWFAWFRPAGALPVSVRIADSEAPVDPAPDGASAKSELDGASAEGEPEDSGGTDGLNGTPPPPPGAGASPGALAWPGHDRGGWKGSGAGIADRAAPGGTGADAAPWALALQWIVTGWLWSQWLIQDLANLYVYLPRHLAPDQLALSLVVLCAAIGLLLGERGGAVQGILLRKRDLENPRATTALSLLYGLVLSGFGALSRQPMSTTWVFLGLLAGRELALLRLPDRRAPRQVALDLARDVLLAALGLAVSLLVALAVRLLDPLP